MKQLPIKSIFWICTCMTLANAGSIRGTVIDQNNKSVNSVKVLLQQTGSVTYTDTSGEFVLEPMKTGTYEVHLSHHDYISKSILISLVTADTFLTIPMQSAVEELARMTVIATAAPSRLDEVSRTVSVKNEEELQKVHAQSLGDAMKNMPGVQLAQQGPNVTKPVIRGMTNQRIVLVRDGSRHEAQQWSNHHTPEVDIADASQIEVLRGPGSLLYGSGALGGVILIKSPRIMTTEDGARPVGADAMYQFFTNSEQHSGHIGLHGAWSWGAWRLDVSGRNAPHFAVPGENHFLVKQAAGVVSDSVATEFAGFRQYNVRLMTGIRKDNYEISLSGTQYHEEQKLIGEGHWHNSGGPDGGPWYHVGEPILSPTLHQKIQINSLIFSDDNTFAIDIAGQHNHRQGIPGSIGVQVDLENYYATANGRWSYSSNVKLPGTLGISVSRKQDRTDGVEVLIPDYNTTDAGLFLLQDFRLSENLKGSIGLRGDVRDYRIFRTRMTEGFRPYLPATLRGVTVDSIPSLFVEGTDRMAVPSFNAGLYWKPPPMPFSLAVNFGTGFRLPDPNELAILGAHHGSYEYLVGLAVKDPRQGSVEINEIGSYRETAYNSDLILRLSKKIFQTECSFFYNRLNDYIYAKPTGGFIWLSAISALPVKEYVQTDAHIYGFEISGTIHPLPWLTFDCGFDISVGEILDDVINSDGDGNVEQWLPGIQPPRITSAISLEQKNQWFTWLPKTGFKIGIEGYFAQTRLAEFENVLRKDSQGNNVLFPSEGYILFNTGADADIKLFSKTYTASVEVTNLFNTRYTSHLSSYKGIAENPGFDLSVKITAGL